MKDDGSLVPKHLVGPASDGADELDGPYAIVGNQDLPNGPLPLIPVHKLFRSCHLRGGGGRMEGKGGEGSGGEGGGGERGVEERGEGRGEGSGGGGGGEREVEEGGEENG